MITASHAPARRAMYGVLVIFFSAGFVFSGWAARIPTVQSSLGLSPGEMGILLLVGSVGSIISLPLAGRLVGRYGARRTVGASVIVVALALSGAVTAVEAGAPVVVGVLLMVSLAGVGAMDVAMNFEGTLAERVLRRSIMPQFHGAYSLGTIAGAGLGTLASRGGVPITVHLWSTTAVVLIAALIAIRSFLPDEEHVGAVDGGQTQRRGSRTGYSRAWLEPRTLMVGLIVMAVSLAEGAANDWLALGIREGFHVPEHQGALGLTLFVTAMTIMRFSGTRLLERFGRVKTLRLSAGSAIIGVVIFGLAPSLAVAMAGAVLWGLGVALGFPVGMSAASDEPLHAAARLSVVATIGYGAFLMGPPLLGMLAGAVGYRQALLALLVPLLAALLVMSQAEPLARNASE